MLRVCCECRNLDVQFELGGLPWTCLEGENSGLNWCNAADAASVYRDPPAAWLSTVGRGQLPCLCSCPSHCSSQP